MRKQNLLKKCISKAVAAERNISPQITVYHHKFGSLVSIVFVRDKSTVEDTISDISSAVVGCGNDFDMDNLQISSCEQMQDVAYKLVSFDVDVYVFGSSESLLCDIEEGISFMQSEVRGPIEQDWEYKVHIPDEQAVAVSTTDNEDGMSIDEQVEWYDILRFRDFLFCNLDTP